jgi:hypothetical protein
LDLDFDKLPPGTLYLATCARSAVVLIERAPGTIILRWQGRFRKLSVPWHYVLLPFSKGKEFWTPYGGGNIFFNPRKLKRNDLNVYPSKGAFLNQGEFSICLGVRPPQRRLRSKDVHEAVWNYYKWYMETLFSTNFNYDIAGSNFTLACRNKKCKIKNITDWERKSADPKFGLKAQWPKSGYKLKDHFREHVSWSSTVHTKEWEWNMKDY